MSASEMRPGGPGWNDPPMLNYSAAGNTTRRGVLSQRVAFPMDSTPSFAPVNHNPPSFYQQPYNYAGPSAPAHEYHYQNQPATLLNPVTPAPAQNFQLLPPSTYSELPSHRGPVVVPSMPLMNPVAQASHLPQVYSFQGNDVFPQVAPYQQRVAMDPMSELPVAAVVDTSDLQVPNFADDEQMYHYCVTRLQRALNECQGTTEPRLLNEMQKKLNIFSEMWKSEKISYVVKSTMARLATAIHRRRYLVANELHLTLMMDHVSEVSKWLVGIKKLVQEVEKAPRHPTSPSASCCYDTSGDIPILDLNLQTHGVLNGLPPRVETTNAECQPVVNPTVLQQLSDSLGGVDITRAKPLDCYGADFCEPSTDQFTPRLSCSPPTFDPFKIEQCFNGHGELALKFADENLDFNCSGAKGSLVSHLDGPANGGDLVLAEAKDDGLAFHHQEEPTSNSESLNRSSPENILDDLPGVFEEINLSAEGTPRS